MTCFFLPFIAAAPPFIAGIATVVSLLRNDILVYRHRERSVAIPKIGVCPPMQAAPPFIAGIATVVSLLRNDGLCIMSF